MMQDYSRIRIFTILQILSQYETQKAAEKLYGSNGIWKLKYISQISNRNSKTKQIIYGVESRVEIWARIG